MSCCFEQSLPLHGDGTNRPPLRSRGGGSRSETEGSAILQSALPAIEPDPSASLRSAPPLLHRGGQETAVPIAMLAA
jgi:hypothetical protein